MSGLLVVMGLMAASVGVATAMHRLRVARRAYRKTETLYASLPEGWTSWFLGGFSGFTLGAHRLRAAITLTGWFIGGLWLIGLGLRVFWRA